MWSYLILILVLHMTTVTGLEQICKVKLKVNVLFIIIDDLRLAEISLPNVNKLAEEGAYFKNSYCQQALCAPSRNSLLTGRRPDSLRTYDFSTYWREKSGNYSTIPQIFKENGYQTYSIGKVFHPGKSSNFSDDYPFSWSYLPQHPPAEKYKNWHVCKDRETKKMQKNLICPVSVKSQPNMTLPDLQTLNYATRILTKHKMDGSAFFLAVGLHKPHIPLTLECTREKVDASKIRLPTTPHMPAGMPLVAWHPWSDLRSRDDIARLNITFPLGTMPAKWTRKIKRNYYAASLYMDSLIGELLEHVDMSNTIVVLTSDHGWSLGENGLWAKYSNFDVALRVPIILRAKGIKPSVHETPVELVDIFPTLLELTGISTNKNRPHLHLEGKSLVPIMCGNDTTDYAAFSQYPRSSAQPQHNSDIPKLNEIRIMGYTVRFKRYRYSDWVAFDPHQFTRNWSQSYGKELYDHSSDPYEANNLVDDPRYTDVKLELSMLLEKKVEGHSD